ncbi:MAG: DUF3859 domain-containing protein [Leptospiraceae bacterium]|nr:DUF3859 domain-containing protein [Leptospiraceae bacterium]
MRLIILGFIVFYLGIVFGLYSEEVFCRIEAYGILEPQGNTFYSFEEEKLVKRYKSVHLIQKTSHIDPVLGLNFGIIYKLYNIYTDGHLDTVEERILFPSQGKKQRELIQISSKILPENGVAESFMIFSFDQEEEMKIGTWFFQILYRGKILCGFSFEVQKEDDFHPPRLKLK